MEAKQRWRRAYSAERARLRKPGTDWTESVCVRIDGRLVTWRFGAARDLSGASYEDGETLTVKRRVALQHARRGVRDRSVRWDLRAYWGGLPAWMGTASAAA